MKTKYIVLLAVSLITFRSVIYAQDMQTHQPWSKEDSAAINALVLYPESVRTHIFIACEYPSTIVHIADIQQSSSQAFADLVSTYSKQEQEDIWNLSRYPDLISKLVVGGQKSKAQIDDIANSYPADIHDISAKYASFHFDLLRKINDLQVQTNAQFQQEIAGYTPDVQAAFNDLITLPDAMSLLNDNLNLAVRVGDHYKRNPQRVIQKADSMNAVLTQENAADAEAWKQNIAQDTAAQNELKSAANEYAQDNGANPADVGAPVDGNYVDNYSVAPYPYWFGYPSWYPYAYWYPYPYWYDWGFYYNGFGVPVFIGHPSPYFTNWYFYHSDHWHRYPHLGSVYVNHYYGHPHAITGNSRIVHEWVQNNRQYLPSDFLTNKTHRVEAIRQVGQMNTDLQNRVGKNGQVSNTMRNQYIQQNANRYPALNHNVQQPAIPAEKGVQNVIHQPEQRPAVNTHMSERPPVNNNNRPAQQPTQQPARNYNNIRPAQDLHRNTWEPSRSAPQPHYSAPAPQQHYSAPAPSRPSGGGGRR